MSATILETAVRVTADHIERGKRHVGHSCPIALAIREQWPGTPPRAVFVTDRYASVAAEGEHWLYCEVPDAAATFIDLFDEGREVAPFEFDAEWTRNGGPS